MKRFLVGILFGSLCVLTTGCVYTNIRIPLDTDTDETTLGTREGESTSRSILGLVSWGDAGTKAAAENGGITTVRHLDREILVILGFVYAETTTIAYGD